MIEKENIYMKEIKPDVFVDVYDVLVAFDVRCPATQHAIKKLLMPGERGAKSKVKDLAEAGSSISRAIDIARLLMDQNPTRRITKAT